MANPFARQVQLQTTATTGNGTVITAASGQEHTFYLEGVGTISAGAVQLETARYAAFTGTWAPLGSPVTLATDSTSVVNVTGALLAIRARISTNVVGGGTVTVEYVSN